jgi:hypothetical protein
VLGRVGVGAHEQHLHMRAVGEAGPHLLAVDDEAVTVDDGARLEAGEVGAGVRLGISLAPDFLAGEHFMEVAILLLLRAHEHQGRPDAVDGELVGAVERKREAQDFVLVNRLLHQSGATAAIFLGPVERDVTRVAEPPMVFEQPLPSRVVAGVEQARGRGAEAAAFAASEDLGGGFFEPSVDFRAKRFFFRGESEIHAQLREVDVCRAATRGV